MSALSNILFSQVFLSIQGTKFAKHRTQHSSQLCAIMSSLCLLKHNTKLGQCCHQKTMWLPSTTSDVWNLVVLSFIIFHEARTYSSWHFGQQKYASWASSTQNSQDPQPICVTSGWSNNVHGIPLNTGFWQQLGNSSGTVRLQGSRFWVRVFSNSQSSHVEIRNFKITTN